MHDHQPPVGPQKCSSSTATMRQPLLRRNASSRNVVGSLLLLVVMLCGVVVTVILHKSVHARAEAKQQQQQQHHQRAVVQQRSGKPRDDDHHRSVAITTNRGPPLFPLQSNDKQPCPSTGEMLSTLLNNNNNNNNNNKTNKSALPRMTEYLRSQIKKYDAKVLSKLTRERPRSWERFLFDYDVTSHGGYSRCVRVVPECRMFSLHGRNAHDDDGGDAAAASTTTAMMNNWTLLSEARSQYQSALGGRNAQTRKMRRSNSSDGGGESLLFAKCCYEHTRLRNALRCWQRFLSRHGDDDEQYHHRSTTSWWLAFGTLLGSIRAVAIEHRPATIIPWDTDIDIMLEGGTAFADSVKQALEKGEQQHLFGGCPARLAPRELQDHVHGTLLGYVYGVDSPSESSSSSSAFCEDCSRIELWIRHDLKKTQTKEITFPLRHNLLRLYDDDNDSEGGAVAAPIPNDFAEVLTRGYGPQWCYPCKHRTSACKNVTLH